MNLGPTAENQLVMCLCVRQCVGEDGMIIEALCCDYDVESTVTRKAKGEPDMKVEALVGFIHWSFSLLWGLILPAANNRTSPCANCCSLTASDCTLLYQYHLSG